MDLSSNKSSLKHTPSRLSTQLTNSSRASSGKLLRVFDFMDRNFLKCGYSVLKLNVGKRKIIDENEVLCVIAEERQQLYCFLKAREFLKLRPALQKIHLASSSFVSKQSERSEIHSFSKVCIIIKKLIATYCLLVFSRFAHFFSLRS